MGSREKEAKKWLERNDLPCAGEMHAVPQFHASDLEVRSIWGVVLMHLPVLQIKGTAACLGVDALDERAMRMTRFVAPVTMLATGGAGQVPISPF